MSDRLVLVCDKVKELLGPETYEQEIRPILQMTYMEGLQVLVKDIQIDDELDHKTNEELAELLLIVWAELPLGNPLAPLLSEVMERLNPELKYVEEE